MRKGNYVHIGVRDGREVKLKNCRDCGEEKVVAEDDTSEFSPARRKPDGSVAFWSPNCKKCAAAASRNMTGEELERRKANAKARYHYRMQHEPGYAEKRNTVTRKYKRTWRERNLEKERERNRQWKRNERLRNKDKVNADNRMWYRLRLERQGKTVRPVKTEQWVDNGRLILPGDRFAAWLREYGRRIGEPEGERIAHDLGIEPRRITSVLNSGSGVSIATADKAILSARFEIDMDGEVIWSVFDLYPGLEEEMTAV